MTTDKILDKLAKIKAHMESAKKIGSEAEAQAFAEMLQKLLLKHKLDMTDIEVEAEEKAEPVDRYDVDLDSHGLKTKASRVGWSEKLAVIVARAHFCRILIYRGSNLITIVGRKSDAAVAEFLYVTLLRAAESIAQKEYVKFFYECRDAGDVRRARGFKASFLVAFVSRIEYRLDQVRRAEASSSTAIVRVNRAELAVKQFMDGMKTRTIKSLTHVAKNAEGYNRGKAAADRVNLTGNAFEGSASAAARIGDGKIDLGDLVRVKKGHVHEGVEFRVTATGRHDDGERLVISGILRFRESSVELVSKMQCAR